MQRPRRAFRRRTPCSIAAGARPRNHWGAAMTARSESSIESSASLSILKIPTAKVFEPLLEPARYKAAFGGRGYKVLGLGTTDPLAGVAAITANLVVSFYFAQRAFENVARIIKR